VNENEQKSKETMSYKTFDEVFRNLKRECREVDMDEYYTTMGYIENMFWRLFLFGSYYVCKNR